MYLKEGSLLQNGKYKILRVLGQGGFGITYLAEDIYLERKVAVKEFFPKDYCDRDHDSCLTLGTSHNRETVSKLRDRFIKEAKNLAKLDNPGVVRVYDVFEENNTAYYVMDYIEGITLQEMVKRNGPLSEHTAVGYILRVGEALQYVHSHNMTHFDVKPANIIIRKDRNIPILIDFGLSKQFDSEGHATSTIMQAVSHGYSPIELYAGGSEENDSVPVQTDIYSLGATLYYILTGTVPPPPTEILSEGLSFPPGISGVLKSTITKAMNIRKDDRHESVKEFCNQLRQDEIEDEQTRIVQDESTRIYTAAPDKGENLNKPSFPNDGSAYANIETGKKGKDKNGNLTKIVLSVLVVLVIAAGVLALVFSDGCDGSDKKDWEYDSLFTETANTPSEGEANEESDVSAVDEPVAAAVDAAPAAEEEEWDDSQQDYPSVRQGVVGQVLSSEARTVHGKKCHFFQGSFTYDGQSWPVMVAFIEDNGRIISAEYKNVQYKAQIKMSCFENGDDLTLVGKSGDNFAIYLTNAGNGSVSGYTNSGNLTMDVNLYPTTQTFSF